MLGIKVRTHEALDFGCGLGRLSQALAARFDQVCAVDISSVMIDKARAHNRHGKKCTYYCNPHDNLSMFADGQFDFIYSNLVLQHMEPQYAKKYIREFLRVLHDDGTLLFQAPELHAKSSTANKANDDTSSPSSSGKRSRTLLHAFYWWLKRRWFSQPIMELYGIPKDEMVSFIENLDGRIVDIVLLEEDKFGKFNRYCVVKAKRGLSGEQTRL
jgi:ubiquinone/menaquinone biosynthesis C-methylase UbiE